MDRRPYRIPRRSSILRSIPQQFDIDEGNATVNNRSSRRRLENGHRVSVLSSRTGRELIQNRNFTKEAPGLHDDTEQHPVIDTDRVSPHPDHEQNEGSPLKDHSNRLSSDENSSSSSSSAVLNRSTRLSRSFYCELDYTHMEQSSVSETVIEFERRSMQNLTTVSVHDMSISGFEFSRSQMDFSSEKSTSSQESDIHNTTIFHSASLEISSEASNTTAPRLDVPLDDFDDGNERRASAASHSFLAMAESKPRRSEISSQNEYRFGPRTDQDKAEESIMNVSMASTGHDMSMSRIVDDADTSLAENAGIPVVDEETGNAVEADCSPEWKSRSFLAMLGGSDRPKSSKPVPEISEHNSSPGGSDPPSGQKTDLLSFLALVETGNRRWSSLEGTASQTGVSDAVQEAAADYPDRQLIIFPSKRKSEDIYAVEALAQEMSISRITEPATNSGQSLLLTDTRMHRASVTGAPGLVSEAQPSSGQLNFSQIETDSSPSLNKAHGSTSAGPPSVPPSPGEDIFASPLPSVSFLAIAEPVPVRKGASRRTLFRPLPSNGLSDGPFSGPGNESPLSGNRVCDIDNSNKMTASPMIPNAQLDKADESISDLMVFSEGAGVADTSPRNSLSFLLMAGNDRKRLRTFHEPVATLGILDGATYIGNHSLSMSLDGSLGMEDNRNPEALRNSSDMSVSQPSSGQLNFSQIETESSPSLDKTHIKNSTLTQDEPSAGNEPTVEKDPLDVLVTPENSGFSVPRRRSQQSISARECRPMEERRTIGSPGSGEREMDISSVGASPSVIESVHMESTGNGEEDMSLSQTEVERLEEPATKSPFAARTLSNEKPQSFVGLTTLNVDFSPSISTGAETSLPASWEIFGAPALHSHSFTAMAEAQPRPSTTARRTFLVPDLLRAESSDIGGASRLSGTQNMDLSPRETSSRIHHSPALMSSSDKSKSLAACSATIEVSDTTAGGLTTAKSMTPSTPKSSELFESSPHSVSRVAPHSEKPVTHHEAPNDIPHSPNQLNMRSFGPTPGFEKGILDATRPSFNSEFTINAGAEYDDDEASESEEVATENSGSASDSDTASALDVTQFRATMYNGRGKRGSEATFVDSPGMLTVDGLSDDTLSPMMTFLENGQDVIHTNGSEDIDAQIKEIMEHRRANPVTKRISLIPENVAQHDDESDRSPSSEEDEDEGSASKAVFSQTFVDRHVGATTADDTLSSLDETVLMGPHRTSNTEEELESDFTKFIRDQIVAAFFECHVTAKRPGTYVFMFSGNSSVLALLVRFPLSCVDVMEGLRKTYWDVKSVTGKCRLNILHTALTALSRANVDYVSSLISTTKAFQKNEESQFQRPPSEVPGPPEFLRSWLTGLLSDDAARMEQ